MTEVSLTVAALSGLVPALFWLWYITTRDRYEREPKRLIWRTVAWGALACIPAALLESLTGAMPLMSSNSTVAIGVGTLFLVGPIEEGCKFLAVRWSVYHEPDFNEPLDGIIYGASASLGFSALENVLYIFSFGPGIALVRALLSTPLHFTVGSLWGAALGRAKFTPDGGTGLILGALAAAAIFHGGFDFLVSLNQAWSNALAILVLLPFLWTIWNRNVREALAISPFRAAHRCGRCGAFSPIQARFCVACGTPLAPEGPSCPACRRPVPAGHAFCVGCGARL